MPVRDPPRAIRYNGHTMTTFNSPGYDLQRFTGRCAFTGRPLEVGQTYVATLVEDGETFRRVDVSVAAWDEGRRPEQLFSFWKTVVPEPNAKKKLFVDDEVLFNLLQRLEDATQPQRLAFRFVLMLILLRKKLLRYDRTESRSAQGAEGEPAVEQDWWVLTPKLDITKGPMSKWHDQARLHVLDPHLDDEGVRQVTEQLSDILQAEL